MSSPQAAKDAQDAREAAALLSRPRMTPASRQQGPPREQFEQEESHQGGEQQDDPQQDISQQEDLQHDDSQHNDDEQQEDSQQEDSQQAGFQQEGSQHDNNDQEGNFQQEDQREEDGPVDDAPAGQEDIEAPTYVWLVEELWWRHDLQAACQRTLGVFETVEAAKQYAEDFVRKVERLTKRDKTVKRKEILNLVDEEVEKQNFAPFAGSHRGTDPTHSGWLVSWYHGTTVSVVKKRVWRARRRSWTSLCSMRTSEVLQLRTIRRPS